MPKRLSPPSERFFSYPQEVDLFHSGSMGIRNPREGMKLELIIKSIVKIKETSIPRSGIHESVILTKKRKLFNKAVIRHAA